LKYLCLGYYDEKRFEALPKPEVAAIVAQCHAHDAALHASGKLLMVASLESPQLATSIRPKAGMPSVTDGPFAETKEQLGAFFIIEADDRDEAIRIASMHPAAHLGEQVGWGVEVRAIEMFQQS
jgi:hypothetical protein